MKLKCLNRSVLKWIALVTMLIDHIGAVLGLETFAGWGLEWLYYLLRTIGRLSFPIFAFFIAEGYYYTKNKTRYVLLLLVFAIISQPIYYFALNQNLFDFNILFTFLLSILVMFIVDISRKNPNYSFMYYTFIFAIGIITVALSLMGMPISYGVYGVFLPVVFYAFNHSTSKYAKTYMWVIAFLIMVLYWGLSYLMLDKTVFNSYIDLFAVLSLVLLYFYNGQKGKGAPKYLFYIFYPAHILVLFLIKLLI